MIKGYILGIVTMMVACLAALVIGLVMTEGMIVMVGVVCLAGVGLGMWRYKVWTRKAAAHEMEDQEAEEVYWDEEPEVQQPLRGAPLQVQGVPVRGRVEPVQQKRRASMARKVVVQTRGSQKWRRA